MKKQSTRSSRKMKQIILVLCEGETEECYINMLKQQYRLPIKVIPKVVGQNINQRLIDSYIKEFKLDRSDKINCFLMYDADVKSVVEKINQCKATPLLSNPCLESWFLAHMERINNQQMDVKSCIDKLQTHSAWNTYKKGCLTPFQQKILWEKRNVAKGNIASHQNEELPYSNISNFIDELENKRET